MLYCHLSRNQYNSCVTEKQRKPLAFIGNSMEALRKFSGEAKSSAGHQLDKVQAGQEPDDWKPMPSVGPGASEIRIWEEDGTYRVIYVAKFADAVYVLHAFKKTSQATPQKDIDLAAERYKLIPKPVKSKGKK